MGSDNATPASEIPSFANAVRTTLDSTIFFFAIRCSGRSVKMAQYVLIHSASFLSRALPCRERQWKARKRSVLSKHTTVGCDSTFIMSIALVRAPRV